MSYNLIPVLTVDDEKYNQPTQDEGGLYVVNKGVLQDAPSNKFYFYNPASGKYYNINERTASPDFLKQITEYEQRLQNIGRMKSVTTDPNQINSLADVTSILFSGDVSGTLSGFGDLVENTIVDPLFDKDLKGQRTAVLFNNFLVNLGETMDYFTGANAIKALLQGKSVKEGYVWDEETGRSQYDWNVETGAGGLADFGVNFALEFISDPTNWITLGGKQAVKEILTSSVDDVATSMGLTANKQYIKALTKNLTGEFGTADTLKHIDYKSLFNLSNDVDVNTIANINKALNASLESKYAVKQIKLINSVMGTADYYEKAAFKAANATSALGLEFMAVKGGAKHILPWVNKKLGNILKHNGVNGEYRWSDYEKVYRDAEEAATVYNIMTKTYDYLPKEAAETATRKMREDILRDIQKTVDINKNSFDKTVPDLNELAKKKGFGGIQDMYEYFVTIKNNIDGSVTPIVSKLNSVLKDANTARRQVKLDFLDNVDNLLRDSIKPVEQIKRFKEYTSNPLKHIDRTLKALNTIKDNFVNYGIDIPVDEFSKVISIIKLSNAMEGLQYIISREVYTEEITNELLEELDSIAKLLENENVPPNVISALENMRLYAAYLLNNGGTKSDELSDFIDAAIVAIEQSDETIAILNEQWSSAVENFSNILFQIKDSFIEEAATASDLINLSGHKTATILEEYRGKDNMLASTALKKRLDDLRKNFPNTPTTEGAFIHPADFKQLNNTVLNLTIDNCLPNTSYTIDELKQLLVSIFDKRELYGYEEDITLIHKVFEKTSTNTLSATVNDLEELIVTLRRRAKDLKKLNNPSEDFYFLGDDVLFESIADNLADYLDDLCTKQYGKMSVDTKQLYSKLYAVKLSQAESLKILLSDTSVTDLLNSILDSREGVGAFIRTLEHYEGTSEAAETLHALAESTRVYGTLLNGLRKSSFITDEWADAITDSLAGIMRRHIFDVHLDDLTAELLDHSKLFINKSNSNLPNTSKYVTDEFLPEKQADLLADILFNSVRPYTMSDDTYAFYGSLLQNLAESNTFNAVFSIGQHSKQAGVFEFVCELPEEIAGYGKKVHFVDDSVNYENYFADPRYASEILSQKSPVIIEKAHYAPNAIHFNSTDEFVTAISNFLETLKTHVNPPKIDADQFRDIQFLGFGNSVGYNNQNGVLRDFLLHNKIDFSLNNYIQSRRNAKCVDIKELIHLDSGATTITDELYNAVREELEVAKSNLDSWNSRTSSAKAYIMPDFSTSVQNAVDTLIAEIENALVTKPSSQLKRTPDVPTTTASLMEYSEKVLGDMAGALRNFSNHLNSNLRNIRESNAAYASELIVAKVFNELTGEPNIMRYVTKYLVNGVDGGLSPLALKTYHDPDLVASWYDLKIFEGKNIHELLKANELLKRLQGTSDRITRPELLYAPSSMSACDEVIETLRNVLEQHSNSTIVRRNITNIDLMRKGLMPEQTYAIAVYYMKEFNKLPERIKEAVSKMCEAKWETNLDAQSYWGLVARSEDTVLNNKKGIYVPEIDSFKKMKLDESHGSVYHALETRREVMYSKHNIECFKDSLKLQDEVMSKHNVNSPIYKMQRSMIEAYVWFIDTVTSHFDSARNDCLYNVSNTSDAVKRYEHKQMYTERIKIYQEQLNKIAECHSYTRAYNILNMDINAYEKYLFKYSQGIQLFDTSSEVLRNKDFVNDLLKRIEFLNSANNKTSLRTIQNGKYVIVYVDKNVVDAEYLERLRRTATGYEVDGKYTPAINMHFNAVPDFLKDSMKDNLFFDEYTKLQDEIEHTHNVAYSLSTHRAMNGKKLTELYGRLPKEFTDKLLDVNYWTSAGLVQGGLIHNVVGDYNSGLGDIFSTYSGNIITNINSGFSKLYKQGVSREAYVTLFTSPVNSLKSRVNMVNTYLKTKLTAKEVHEAVEEMGYKVASFTSKEIKLFDVSTEKGFKKALDEDAILIDSGLYDKVYRTMVDNSLPSVKTGVAGLDKFINGGLSYMHLLKLGQLQSPGWIMRNIVDSTVKGAIASNANVYEYVSMIPTVIKKLKTFDELVATIYNSEKSLSEFSIKRYYTKNPDQNMSLEEFLDYFNFSKNSASVPTPAQLNILNNVEQRLLRLFTDESNIKDIHIRTLLKKYIDNDGNYTATKGALEEVYDNDTVLSLMNVFDKIPKGYGTIKDTNLFSKAATWLTDRSYLMKMNNEVERMERFLAYDYNRMMGKTTGAAIDIVNMSQFNRTYDTTGKKILEIIFPFSAFQADNLMFWTNTFTGSSGHILGTLTDFLQAYQNEEELTPEEIATNASVQYMFLQGNIMLDDDGSLVLKSSNSLFNTMNILANPIGYLGGAFNVPSEKLIEFFKALNQDEEEYKANPYGKVKPLSMWDESEIFALFGNGALSVQVPYAGYLSYAAELFPVIGAWWLRAKTAWTDPVVDPLDTVFRCIAPSIFGRVKRTGYDWYGENNNEEYHKTHTFVPGISYIPSWLDTKNPQTYVNTIERLVNMGYDRELAVKMVVDWGYYMKAPDYVLKQFQPNKTYPKKIYAPRPKYTKKIYPKKAYTKSFKMISSGDRYRTTRFGVARIYRLTSMYDRITKSGTSRMTMMLGRGHGASSIRVVRDRIKNNTIRRQRQRRILNMK